MKHGKTITTILAFGALMSLASCGGNGAKEISIVQLGTHLSLNEINDAIVATLKEKGFASGNYKIGQYNAEFDATVASQIISTIKDKTSIVIPIATPVAQAAYNGLKTTTPIVFAAVSDPVGAELMKDPAKPDANITGTSDAIQVSSILDKALVIDPELDELGFIYNAAEANSVTNLEKVRAYCQAKNINLKTRIISAAGEMREIAGSLIDQVDAIFVSDDNTVASAMTALSSACRNAKKPCYVGADSMVKDGGLLCLGCNYTDLGKQTAEMAIQILNGTSVNQVPVKTFSENLSLYLNVDYIQETGIELPSSITGDPNLVEYHDEVQK